MASKRHVRRKSCVGKVGHLTARAGFVAIAKLNQRGPQGLMAVYRCRYCGMYHIGHVRNKYRATRGGAGGGGD
jgi:hypothetical protein